MNIEQLSMLAHQDRVLVLVDADIETALNPGETTCIVVPEAHRRFSRTGVVLHVGCGREMRKGFAKTTLRPGDRVLLPVSCDDMHAYDVGAGRECRILSEAEILGVVE